MYGGVGLREVKPIVIKICINSMFALSGFFFGCFFGLAFQESLGKFQEVQKVITLDCSDNFE